MAFVAKSLANGNLATSWAAIYTATNKSILKSVDFFNHNAATQTVELRLNRTAGGTRNLPRAVLEQDESFRFLTDGETLIMSAGDVLEAQTTTVSVVDFNVTGADEA